MLSLCSVAISRESDDAQLPMVTRNCLVAPCTPIGTEYALPTGVISREKARVRGAHSCAFAGIVRAVRSAGRPAIRTMKDERMGASFRGCGNRALRNNEKKGGLNRWLSSPEQAHQRPALKWG